MISAAGFQGELTFHLNAVQGEAKHPNFKQLGVLVSCWKLLDAHSHPESLSHTQVPEWRKFLEPVRQVQLGMYLSCSAPQAGRQLGEMAAEQSFRPG